MEILWGDIHNHAGISYAYGSLRHALAFARQQLDFCAVIGHATWHDMPREGRGAKRVAAYHSRGFRRLAARWEGVRRAMEEANEPGSFVTFQGYEAHSRAFGDYFFLSPAADLPLVVDKPPLAIARELPDPVIAVPHHIAYVPGYRGINWDAYREDLSPVVEVFSKHGCGISDTGPYPYLHTMGPRDGRNTVEEGLARGHQFGFTASTDHHAGFPGSYGDGRTAVYAGGRTREAIWDALQKRRTYAVTGDRIECHLEINGALMGEQVACGGDRRIGLRVRARDRIRGIVIYRNNEPWEIVCGMEPGPGDSHAAGVYLLRLEMGWGRESEGFTWHGDLRVSGGELRGVETCFCGPAILSPEQEAPGTEEVNAVPNRILHLDGRGLGWECTSYANVSTLHPQTAMLVLEIAGEPSTGLEIDLNGRTVRLGLADVLDSSRGFHLEEYCSEAFLVHRALPAGELVLEREWVDPGPTGPLDVYRVEVAQRNGQYAWLSPIFVRSG